MEKNTFFREKAPTVANISANNILLVCETHKIASDLNPASQCVKFSRKKIFANMLS
jgi:hypothetical protein